MLKTFLNKLFKTNKEVAAKEGTVKFFNRTKGFGFITVTDTNDEIFVHKSSLNDKIREGDVVAFEVEKGERGPTAVNVKRLKRGKPKRRKKNVKA
ncbi:cold-shock protein [Bizionia sediminis]|uniref:Cold-shock protein n=1 Tax=Bizionia sediminis TaxID=1737064 RepID=A0ABW5KR98_9FLAO